MKCVCFLVLVMLFIQPPAGFCQTDFTLADSLYAADHWIAAVDEYAHFLRSDRTDYALYRIGMCKDNIATHQNNVFFQETFGDKPELYHALREYVNNRPEEFRPFSPEGIYISNGAEFKRILAEYPKSDYVDDSAYRLLLQSLHHDWEGYVPIMVAMIERCKAFLQHYPTSAYTDEVVERCVQFYGSIQQGVDMTLAERRGYARGLERFKQEWK